jgi:hypothetical protein
MSAALALVLALAATAQNDRPYRAFDGDLKGLSLQDTTDVLQLGGECVTTHGLTIGDTIICGKLEVDDLAFFDSSLRLANGASLFWGSTSAQSGSISFSTTQTPDSLVLGLGNLSRSLLVMEYADIGTDFAFALQANPTVAVFSSDSASPTEYIAIAHDGVDGDVMVGSGNLLLAADALIAADHEKDLVDATPTAFVRVAIAPGDHNGAIISYEVHADDGSAFQIRTGTLTFAAINVGGTETCDVQASALTEATAVSTGSLSASFSCASTVDGTVDISVNANTSIATPTTLEIHYQMSIGHSYVVTPL